jgi:hypothetical protein
MITTKKMKLKVHFWIGYKSGILESYSRFNPPKGKNMEQIKYLGYAKTGLEKERPIELNTGRILYEDSCR